MGNQFRSDSSKAQATEKDDEEEHRDRRARRERQDLHAYGPKTVDNERGYAEKAVETRSGTDADVQKRYSDALMAGDRKAAMAAVMDMSTKARQELKEADVLAISIIGTPRDVMMVADFAQVSPNDALRAILAAKPEITPHELRGYLADGEFSHIALDDGTVAALKNFAGKKAGPLDLFSELDDVLGSKALFAWYLEVTPAKTVARDMLATESSSVANERTKHLLAIGDHAWDWLAEVDETMAKRTPSHVLDAYKSALEYAKQPVPPALQAAVSRSHDHEKVDEKAKAAEHAELQRHRAEIVASKSPAEIVEAARAAGLGLDDQLAWLLDKPGLTAAAFHRQTATMPLRGGISDATINKLIATFPTTSVTELFGDVPEELADAGAAYERVARWLLRGAAPETILQLVTIRAQNVSTWCGQLQKVGVGYGWVSKLGGRWNDELIRRFVLHCPDEPTVAYIESRLLGKGAHDTAKTTAPYVNPDTFAPPAKVLDTDLKSATARTPQNDQQRAEKAELVAGDVVDLTAADRAALAKDKTKLEQLLVTSDKATFVRIIDEVPVDLSLVMKYAPGKISGAALIRWCQNRPAAEVGAFLRDADLVSDFRSLVSDIGLFDCLPTAAGALAPVLGPERKDLVTWMLECTPTIVLHALASSTALLDAAAKALAPFANKLDTWLPPAAALDAVGRAALHQLAARAHGALRDVLDKKLAAKLPDPDDDEADADHVTADALAIHESKGDPSAELGAMIARNGSPSAVRAFLQSHHIEWKAAKNADIEALAGVFDNAIGPDVATGQPLAKLLAAPGMWAWALRTVPGHRLLSGMVESNYAVIAGLLSDAGEERNLFLSALPRGRLLTAEHKQALHAIAQAGVSDYVMRRLFEIAWDTPLDRPAAEQKDGGATRAFTGPEIEKMWTALEKVPHAHVDERSVRNFVGVTAPPGNGTLGMYDYSNREISIDKASLDEKDTLYNKDSMTEEQAVAAVGSKTEFDELLKAKKIVKNDDGTFSFPKYEFNEFTQTVLHEVGHSVDAMLGDKSELVYKLAGWQRFGLDMFEDWAQSLGGWDTVTKDDKESIARVYKSWLAGGGKGSPAELVGSAPWLDKRETDYKLVGVVQLAKQTRMHDYGGVDSPSGTRAMVGPQEFFTISRKGFDAAPSAYATSAPREYFAECYATYYGEFVETKGKAPKGQRLVPWIKSWFDTHIDNIGHNPQLARFPRGKP